MATTVDPLHVLLVGLKTAWTAAGATLSSINGPHRAEKPPIVADGFPYVVVVAEPSICVQWTCDNEYWEHEVTFWVYNKTPETTAGNAATIRGVFDDEQQVITLSSGSIVRKRSERSEHVQLDKDIWRVSVPYSFLTSRPRVNQA